MARSLRIEYPGAGQSVSGNGNSVWTGKTDCGVKLDLLIVDYEEARNAGKGEAPIEFEEGRARNIIRERIGRYCFPSWAQWGLFPQA